MFFDNDVDLPRKYGVYLVWYPVTTATIVVAESFSLSSYGVSVRDGAG